VKSLKKAMMQIEDTQEDKPKLFKKSIQELADKKKIVLKLRK
jgi:hypothetical protein